MSDFPANLVLEHFSALSERLSALFEQFSTLDAKVETVSTDLTGKIESLGIDLIGKIESGSTDLTGEIDNLRNDFTSKVGDLSNDLMTIRSELMARTGRPQDTMTRLQNEVFVSFAQVERIGSRSIGASDEARALATQVTAMQRVMLNLSARVDEIYLKG